MAGDTQYAPITLLYKSRGLIARYANDRAPEFTYLDMLNAQEREEDALSSRYGYQIINRDPIGSGGENYYFGSPVTSLSRLIYLGNAWRYAGLSDGTLWRREGNSQGPYTQIYAGLSGQPFGSLSTSCYGSSQPYLFIYDADVSIKDNGAGTPQLTGIDPPTYTANTVPYSPLLTLINNFNSTGLDPNGNGFVLSSSGWVSGWNYHAPPIPLTATNGQQVNDFSEFFGISTAGGNSYAISGGSSVSPPNSPPVTFSGFPLVAISPSDTVAISINISDALAAAGSSGFSEAVFAYSVDGGTTYTVFHRDTLVPPNVYTPATSSFSQAITFSVTGLTNLGLLRLQAYAQSNPGFDPSQNSANATYNGFISVNVSSSVVSPFNQVVNGMLSVLNSNSSINVPITSVESTGLSFGVYQTLTITTLTPHGLADTASVSIYGSSNDLVDGFYFATVTGSSTLTVPFVSPTYINSTGGTLNGGAAAPSTCVLTNEYSSPYPNQMTAWGFYQQVPTTTTHFPVSYWAGTVAQNVVATVGVTTPINLNINNQATDDDLIVLVVSVGDPAAISNIRLQFDVNDSGYSSSYYYKDIAPTFYQQGVEQLEDAYTATSQQILADTLGLITGQPPNSTTAQLQPSNLSTGQGSWQTCYLRRGDFVAVGSAGQSGADWGFCTGWQLVVTTNTVGPSEVALNGLYFQWGYGPSSFGGVGYDYRYSYYNANTGTESNGSPIQQFNTQFGYLSSLAAPIFLRQATQDTGYYSSDSQVTHVRIYRRGGNLGAGWFYVGMIPNVTSGGKFYYKDVIPDATLLQSNLLVLDNDPPVTSSLQNPIVTSLSQATIGPGSTVYSSYSPQTVYVADATAKFVVGQLVDMGNSNTLEQVRVVVGGTGQFSAIVRLQHNAGEPVYVYSVPRQPCALSALAYGRVWLAGDPHNPNLLYYSKPGYPENFGPQDYVKVGESGDTIISVINWRGQLVCETMKSWYLIANGNPPYAQPTGSKHGGLAIKGWTQDESAIWYRSADGLRKFQGADGLYMSLPVEFVYRNTPQTPIPLADNTQASQDVMCFYNQCVYTSYISLNGGQRYRLVFDCSYQRFRYDDVPATAMLWEEDINAFLCGVEIGPGQYAVVQDQMPNQDYDDGGWSNGNLVKKPILLSTLTPYYDLSKPHEPKQWNMLETDANTQGQILNTEMLFNTEPPTSLTLATTSSTQREKLQLPINAGKGYEAYSASIRHTMSVTTAPIFYQENLYAAVLADVRSTFDTYWIKFGTDESKLVKEGYFDYTSANDIVVNLYADGFDTPYYTFTLPANPNRVVVRVRFEAMLLRRFRLVANSTGDFQMWATPEVSWKMAQAGHSYKRGGLVT